MLQTKKRSKERLRFEGIFREATATMNFIDCLVLTFANIALCLSLPKLLSLMLAPKTNRTQSVEPASTAPVIESEAVTLIPLEG